MFGTTPEVAVLLVLLALKYVATTLLDVLNMRAVRANAGKVPEAFVSFMDEQTFAKSGAYTIEKTKFGIFERSCNMLMLGIFLAFYVLPMMFNYGIDTFGASVGGQALTLILISIVLSIPELPLNFYSQFVIEQAYGFNKTTVKLWIVDNIKGVLVGVIIGAPILALILWFSEVFKTTWWIWGFIAVSIFQVVMIIIFPRVILPLFNKLEPLQEGDLRDRLMALADRGGFKASTIQVIDGSKRSTHSNAFFTGFGRFRRIVLFDTLIEQLEPSEIEAVLAHEIGHYKKGHIIKMIAWNFLVMFITFGVMGWLSASEWFYVGFGFTEAQGFAPVFLMFSLFSGLFTFWLTPISNYFSRKHEYEADAFASKISNADDLKSALRKLHKKNLGNLTPHPIYSAFYYSHPTLLERENALNTLSKSAQK